MRYASRIELCTGANLWKKDTIIVSGDALPPATTGAVYAEILRSAVQSEGSNELFKVGHLAS